jgi:hypothetical protein
MLKLGDFFSEKKLLHQNIRYKFFAFWQKFAQNHSWCP